ncbi:MAG TPA: YhbY family RNA-binding protein [Bacilli bacterium]|nr:YhbY family RNA-binding protein [Bacilli bacterium]
MLTPTQIRYLKAESHQVEPLYQIGKNKLGVTQEALLNNGLNARELIKIKVLKSAELDLQAFGQELATLLKAELVDVKGHVVTLFKAKTKESSFKLPK